MANPADDEDCFHCKLADWIEANHSSRSANEVVGGLATLAADILGRAPSREARRKLVAEACEIIRERSSEVARAFATGAQELRPVRQVH